MSSKNKKEVEEEEEEVEEEVEEEEEEEEDTEVTNPNVLDKYKATAEIVNRILIKGTVTYSDIYQNYKCW